MWSITTDTSPFDFSPGDAVTVYESMNTIQVHSTGKEPEAAKAYLIGFRNGRGTFSMIAYLHFQQSKRREIYAPEGADFELDAYSANEDEGVQFLESMGFMMNNLNYRMLTPDQQAEIQKELPFFWTDLDDFAKFREERIQKSAGDHEVQEVTYRVPDAGQTREGPLSGVFRAAADGKPGSGLIKPGTGVHPAEGEVVRETDDAKLARLLSSF